MRIFVDANVILDVLLKRDEFFVSSKATVDICKRKHSSLAPHTISNIFFITRKDLTVAERKLALLDLLEYIDIVPTGKHQIKQALLNNDIEDFEDALQLECAYEFNADYIVTRDLAGFANSQIDLLTPEQFIEKFGGAT